ncbi:MAG: hypothetical protein PHQ40_08750 [Anaerolineaceae bacterium]|nr:hypothetical protein [Anaerolineaceae bacterium]
MEDNQAIAPMNAPVSGAARIEQPKSSRGPIIIVAIVAVVILVAIVAGIVFLARSDIATTGKVRDIFIIFMALEFLVIGVALTVLMVQLATLINLLQNEIKPILTSTSETVSTLRGTITFLSDNLVEPVIRMNEYLAAIKRLLDLLHLVRR